MNNELVKFDLSQPAQALQMASVLQQFVKEKKLTSNIKGKEYPLVESWQFAGSQLGLYPLLISIKDLSNDKEVKYLAEVEVRRISDDKVLSRGVALCSNREASKRAFDEYAILSMAQTRAEGKAFRMLLAWLMKAAGFEATPAEEMDFKRDEPDFSDVPTEGERQILRDLAYNATLSDTEKESVLLAIETCQTYGKYKYIQDNLEVRQLPFDQIQNPLQKDINNHLKKTVK